ncbi:hypothetical protein [Archangium primigenium]|uniref:hypothetical protein n=1 Tax=[Archangium] primigenium TaxID=2792470 RepID=UPI0019590C05|nr:hypothetical protein [Archangium primigenium]MBM7112865.1 hypothetical protein [Archangium primigenium]
MDVYLEGKRLRLNPSKALGKGGEADVFDLGDGRVLKLFKPPEHPDHGALVAEQDAARARLVEHQRKLPAFPKHLPPRVVSPQALATDKGGGKVVGYAMRKLDAAEPLRRFGEPSFRRAGVPSSRVVTLFQDLHRTLGALHGSGVVVGDFNDLNVLVIGDEAWLIDADSFQFGPYLASVFTERFLDPLRLGSAGALVPARPASMDSDWYAFGVALMQSLVCVGPYGGVLPKVTPTERVLRRLTVFHPDVRYPKPATPLGVLPDDLLHGLHRVFVEDARGPFPWPLLESLRFHVCASCGVEHARATCPTCRPSAVHTPTPVTTVRGQVVATRLFSTEGVVVHASVEEGVLRWLVHERGAWRREDGAVVLQGPLQASLTWAIHGASTLVGQGPEFTVLAPGRRPERLGVDAPEGRPAFAANARHRYWAHAGVLWRDGTYGPERLGDVLEGQTRLFVGPRFGLGFHRAGALRDAFVFDAERPGLKDGLKLPWPSGRLVDAEAVFEGALCWLLLAEETAGRTVHHCVVVGADGGVKASATALAGDGSWLGTLRGKCAAGEALFAATDTGLVRVALQQGQLVPVREFPDTEPFVDADTRLLLTTQGLVAVGRQAVTLLRMS